MVQELAYETNFSAMFHPNQHTSRIGGYNTGMPPPPTMPGLPFYGATHQTHQYQDYGQYDPISAMAQSTGLTPLAPPPPPAPTQGESPSPNSWAQTSAMYQQQPVNPVNTSTSTTARHTPPPLANNIDEWSHPPSQISHPPHSHSTPYNVSSSTSIPVTLNGQSTYSYRPSMAATMGVAPFSTELNSYGIQSPPGGMVGMPAASQSPSPVGSGGSGGGAHNGTGSSPINRQSRVPYDWLKRQGYHSATHSSGKTRTKDKYRIVYSEYQKVELEKEYLYSKYITIQRKAELARNIGLSERQVKIWFQNRRAKERKQKRKREDSATMPSPEHHSDMKDIKVEQCMATVNPIIY